ncbi:MAG: hypothetical protein R2788_13930 [Saprospiraceae bacterium]
MPKLSQHKYKKERPHPLWKTEPPMQMLWPAVCTKQRPHGVRMDKGRHKKGPEGTSFPSCHLRVFGVSLNWLPIVLPIFFGSRHLQTSGTAAAHSPDKKAASVWYSSR